MTKKIKTAEEKWVERHSKNATFYLFKAVPYVYFHKWERQDENLVPIERGGHIYTLIWRDHKTGYVKIGGIRDGSNIRYGFATYGVLKGPDYMSLWQSGGGGTISHTEYELMCVLFNEKSLDLPVFDLYNLRDLKE